MKKPKIELKKRIRELFKKLDRNSKILLVLLIIFSFSTLLFTLLLYLPNPLPVDRVETAFASDVYVSDGYAYVADAYYGLLIIDVSDPKNPGDITYAFTSSSVQSVYVSENMAYLAAPDRGLVVINVSDPLNPGNPIYIDTPGSESDVYVVGDIAYIANANANSGIVTVNISDPLNPGTPQRLYLYGYAYGIQVSGELAFVAGIYQHQPSCGSYIGLTIVNVSDVENLHTEKILCTKRYAIDIFLQDDIAYMALYDNGLGIIDITNPLRPSDPIYVDTIGTAFKVHVSDGIAFVADYDEGISMINVTDPLNPGPPLVIDTIGTSFSVFVDNGYAYVADGENGLLIIDISNIFHEVTVYDTNFSIILNIITISALAGIISEILFLIEKYKRSKKIREELWKSQTYEIKKVKFEKFAIIGALIGIYFGFFSGLIYGVSEINAHVIKIDFGTQILQHMFLEMILGGIIGSVIGGSIAGEFLLIASGVIIGGMLGTVIGILVGDILGGLYGSVSGIGMGITTGMVGGALFAIIMRIILRKWDSVKTNRKIMNDFTNKIQKFDGISKSSYKEMKFSDFAISRILSITEIIKVIHNLICKAPISDDSSIEDTIKKLNQKEIFTVKIGDFSYWEQIRRKILREHIEIDKEQADLLEKVYIMAINSLNSFISTNKKQLHLKIDCILVS